MLAVWTISGLRENVRALGEYAVANGKASESTKLVTAFFSALEQYNLVLVAATKDKDTQMDVDMASLRLKASLDALDALLVTVPSDVMAKSRAILSATQSKEAADSEAAATKGTSDEDKLLKALFK